MAGRRQISPTLTQIGAPPEKLKRAAKFAAAAANVADFNMNIGAPPEKLKRDVKFGAVVPNFADFNVNRRAA